MNKSYKHIPKDKRKKILLVTDDIRVHSGVATVAREIVIKTCHHYNWVQIAGALKHPDERKKLDISADCNKYAGIDDASVMLYGVNGYGNPEILRGVIGAEKPDAIFLVTDPRYFRFIFNMEHEIRKNIPIAYLNIWDDYPAPMYNQAFYESCDLLMGISKQTVNINRLVLDDRIGNRILKYVPHGLDHNIYKPIPDDDEELIKFRKTILGNKHKDIDVIGYFN